MKNLILDNLINQIKKNDNYDEEKLEVIRYGLESIYILITKLVIISLLALLMGIFKEFLIFLLIYNIIRMPSFGLHATKSWICLVASSSIFLLAPYLAVNIEINLYLKSVIAIVCLLLIYKNAPADTEKRPIINPVRRLTYKYLSVVIAILMIICSFVIKDVFLSNSFIFSLVVQCFMISPSVYKLFGLPYNNYLHYQET